MTVNTAEFTPALYNESKLTRKTVAMFRELLGEKAVQERPPIMGGEDFSRYGRAGVPIFMYFLGASDPKKVEESERPGGIPLPAMHSDSFAPVPEPTIRTGVLTLSMAVLNLNGK
jgi:metal-dependent amidase/aminoacylase/carboxypeptidase family protein